MIDNSYVLGLFGLPSSGLSPLGSSGVYRPPTARQPTPPWDARAVVPEADDMVRGALAGRSIINENNARLDVPGASADYRQLFSLYQGLETLNALVNRIQVAGIPATETSLIQRRFESGMAELSAYMADMDLEGVRVVGGVAAGLTKTTAGVPRDQPNFVTAGIHEGHYSDPVAAFEGDVVFDITVDRLASTPQTIRIDLSEMGAEPRTFDKVNEFINGKLEAAGLDTRFAREQLPSVPRTYQVGEEVITLPDGADQWGWKILGTSVETVSFQPVQSSDAVYVTQGVGTEGLNQLLKFSADPADGGIRPGESQWVEGRLSQTGLPEGVKAIRASAVDADGAVWMVADVGGEGLPGQPIKGQSDVALMKFDSSGRLISSRALGAASEASGFALAIGDDGRVAVAGSVTGALVAGQTVADAGLSDSFVTVFDADGVEQWTQRRGARAEDEATGVAFGPDGQVYVSGRAKSAMSGAASVGGWDGYIQSFTASQIYPGAPWTAVATSVQQFGTGGDDTVSAMTISGSDLYTAGVENGRAMIRHYTLNADGVPALAATRDLGSMAGEIAGIEVVDGRVIVSGTTNNSALNAGTVTNAHAGGTDAFFASLSGDLAAAGTDRLTYFGGEGNDTAADVKVANGQVWMTGISDRPYGADEEDPTEGYLARFDLATGQVQWSQTWKGQGEQASPATLAVASGGASVLDRLGLPQGEVTQSDSKLLTAATGLRVGDRFTITPGEGGLTRTVTIDARDTMTSLARKIEQASTRRLIATVSTTDGRQTLTIRPRDPERGAILSPGESGRDALAGLGLEPGYVGATSGDDVIKTFGLNLSGGLTLGGPDAIKATSEALQRAMTQLRSAYRALGPQAEETPQITGQAPAYLTAQIANYQAALSRLTGGA